jgi:hypothetical protein
MMRSQKAVQIVTSASAFAGVDYGGSPEALSKDWIPASTGMTEKSVFWLFAVKILSDQETNWSISPA